MRLTARLKSRQWLLLIDWRRHFPALTAKEVEVAVLASLLLCKPTAQAEEKEPSAVVEIGMLDCVKLTVMGA